MMEKGVDAFKGPEYTRLKNKKFKDEIQKKYFTFAADRIKPTFDGSLFFFNHLMPNLSTSPKFFTEILTDKITTMIPGTGDCDVNPQCVPDRWETDSTNREVTTRAKKEWKVTFGPAFFFDMNYGKFILNQNEGSKVYTGSHGQSSKFLVSLVPETGTGSYLVKKFVKIGAGMGGTITANQANAGILSQVGASVAIVPTIGGGKVSESHVGSLGEAKKFKHLKIPDRARDFNAWKINDFLQYDVHGGIVISGGVGFFGLSAGVSYTASGYWSRSYRKLDGKRVQAQLDRNKIMSFGAYAGAAVVSMSVDKFIQWENGLSYIFDLSVKEGRDLLKDFMKGKIKNIQTALKGRSRRGVTFAKQVIGKTSGWSGSFGIGIPFIPASARWGKTNTLTDSERTYLDSTRERNETRVGKVITFRGKFFPFFRNTNDGFFSHVAKTTGSIDFIWGNVKSGQYAYTYQRAKSSRKDLLGIIESLRKKTGLFNFLNITIPKNISGLGSVDLKFAFKMKSYATKFLIAQRKTRNFEIVAQKFMDSYFDYRNKHKLPSKDDLCSIGHRIRGCAKAYMKDTMNAIAKMKKSLSIMAATQSYGKKDRESFARAYTEFGDAMSSNPFTFQTVVNMTQGRGGDVYLSIESTNLKKYEAIMRWQKKR